MTVLQLDDHGGNGIVDALDVRNLSFQYASRDKGDAAFAIEDINFSSQSGLVTCLVGPSGSGKSTVLKLISGYLKADSGTLLVSGVDIGGLDLGRRGTATVHQDYSLLPYLTVYENIQLGPVVAGSMDAQSHDEILRLMDVLVIAHLADRMVVSLSGGEKQRVAIARALAVRPRVILMDEPTASLDMLSRDQLTTIVAALKRAATKTIILVVTHDRDFCLRIADQLAVLDKGKMIWSGLLDQLFQQPTDTLVYKILGTSVFLHGNMDHGRLRIRRINDNFSDVEIHLESVEHPFLTGEVELAIPCNCVELYNISEAFERDNENGFSLRGTIIDKSMSGGGWLDYDIQLMSGEVWRGIRSAKQRENSALSVGLQVHMWIPAASARLFGARSGPPRPVGGSPKSN